MPTQVEIVETPLSMLAFDLNRRNADNGSYAWLNTITGGQLCDRQLTILSAGTVKQLPFGSVRSGQAWLHPLQTCPVLLLFSSSQNPSLTNSVPVWVPGNSILLPTTTGNYKTLVPYQKFNPNLIISTSILNGGFETASATPPAFASWGQGTAGASTVIRDTATFYSGTASCRFTQDAGGNVCNVFQNVLTTGRRYRISLAAKGTAGSTFYFEAGNGALTPIVLSNAWTNYQQEFTAGSARFDLAASGTAGAVQYFDNVLLEDITPQTSFVGFRQGTPVTFDLQPDMKYFTYNLFNGPPSPSPSGNPDYFGLEGVSEALHGGCYLNLYGK